jgi:hypothetical protein
MYHKEGLIELIEIYFAAIGEWSGDIEYYSK